MASKSVSLEKARAEANAAFDEHCKQWDLLQKIDVPEVQHLDEWLSAREKFLKAQERFEQIVRQVS